MRKIILGLITAALCACGQNKKETCDYPFFKDAWIKIRDNYIVQPVKEKEMFSGALAAAGFELRRDLPLPNYDRDPHYSPANLWLHYLRHTKKLPDAEMCRAMIGGMVKSLQSRHSSYLTPTDITTINEMTPTEPGGVKILFRKDAPQAPAIIYKVLEDSEAYCHGLELGDEILEIDGISVSNLQASDLHSLLRDKIGSIVEIIVKKTDGRISQVCLPREKADTNVFCDDLPQKIAYCAVTDFNKGRETKKVFVFELGNKTKFNESKRIILDLRGNPGGDVNQALFIASLRIGARPIVIEKKKGQSVELKGDGPPILKKGKMVILVNGQTASASEILTAAIQDYGLATVVGGKTYGKSEIAYEFELKDGSKITLVMSYWVTRSGKNINKVGITPDFFAETTTEDLLSGRDPQLDAAIDLLK